MSSIGFPGFADRLIISRVQGMKHHDRFITALMEAEAMASDRQFSIIFFEEREYSIRRVEIFPLPRFLFFFFLFYWIVYFELASGVNWRSKKYFSNIQLNNFLSFRI